MPPGDTTAEHGSGQGGRMPRVSKSRPCPICGKPDWCLLAEDESAAICPRTKQGSVKRCGEAGWLHIVRPRTLPHLRRRRRRRCVIISDTEAGVGTPAARADWQERAEQAAAQTSEATLRQLSSQLGVSVESLRRLGFFWTERHRAFGIPMRDAQGAVTGIRLRNWSGRKWAVLGSREGVFVPRGLELLRGPVLIAEGPTDCAAALDLGFESVGRPSCHGALSITGRLVAGADVVVVSDRDDQGRRGAAELAEFLLLYCPTVCTIEPPEASADLRQWLVSGATRERVLSCIDRANPRTLDAGDVR